MLYFQLRGKNSSVPKLEICKERAHKPKGLCTYEGTYLATVCNALWHVSKFAEMSGERKKNSYALGYRKLNQQPVKTVHINYTMERLPRKLHFPKCSFAGMYLEVNKIETKQLLTFLWL